MSSTPRPARPASLPRRVGRQLRRAVGTRHEPLARPLDRSRARAWLCAVLGAVLALALATGGSLLLYRNTEHQVGADRGRLRQVDAVVRGLPDRAAATAAGSRFSGGYSSRVDVDATWTAPDGTQHLGTVQAPRSAVPGSHVAVWVDPAGAASAPPADRVALAVSAACTGAGALLALLALVVLALRLRLHALDRRGEAAWTADWARLEPRWSGRAGHRSED
ncbi:Rv1733c family protein [Kitasatospora sp. NPDC001132]